MSQPEPLPRIEALVTNVGHSGRWVVVQTIITRHGPFFDRIDAAEFARLLTDSFADEEAGS